MKNKKIFIALIVLLLAIFMCKNYSSSKKIIALENIRINANQGDTVDSNGVKITSQGNLDFLNCAIECHKLVREEEFTYGQSQTLPITRDDELKQINTSSYVCMALDAYGLKDWNGYPQQLTVSGGTLVEYARQKDFKFVYEGSATSISEITDLQSGDIVIMPGHAQIFYGYTESGETVWLNCGSTETIRKQEGQDYGWYATPIKYVIRVPSLDEIKNNQSSYNSTKEMSENREQEQTSTTVLPKTGEEFITIIAVCGTILLGIIVRKKIKYQK